MESDVCSVGKNCEPYRDVKGIVLSVLAQVMSLCFVQVRVGLPEHPRAWTVCMVVVYVEIAFFAQASSGHPLSIVVFLCVVLNVIVFCFHLILQDCCWGEAVHLKVPVVLDQYGFGCIFKYLRQPERMCWRQISILWLICPPPSLVVYLDTLSSSARMVRCRLPSELDCVNVDLFFCGLYGRIPPVLVSTNLLALVGGHSISCAFVANDGILQKHAFHIYSLATTSFDECFFLSSSQVNITAPNVDSMDH